MKTQETTDAERYTYMVIVKTKLLITFPKVIKSITIIVKMAF